MNDQPTASESRVVLIHECVTPEVTDEMREAGACHASDRPLAWWHCPECGTSWYLARWYLTGNTFWHLHTRRWEHARKPKRTRLRRWWPFGGRFTASSRSEG